MLIYSNFLVRLRKVASDATYKNVFANIPGTLRGVCVNY